MALGALFSQSIAEQGWRDKSAGILFKQSTLSDISLERFLNTVNGYLTSTFLCAKEFI